MCGYRPRKIVSGGQTGVDRGALDAAICLNIAHGGWCPRGRIAENGLVPHHYRLKETETSDYVVRTERNVVDSDATLILFRDILAGGTRLTYRKAVQHGKPVFLLDLSLLPPWACDEPATPESALAPDSCGTGNDAAIPDKARELLEWLDSGSFETLNVAGPRESGCPGIASETSRLLIRLFST